MGGKAMAEWLSNGGRRAHVRRRGPSVTEHAVVVHRCTQRSL